GPEHRQIGKEVESHALARIPQPVDWLVQSVCEFLRDVLRQLGRRLAELYHAVFSMLAVPAVEAGWTGRELHYEEVAMELFVAVAALSAAVALVDAVVLPMELH
ncbi:hypothetical protein AGABI1DRAFT_96091, partial [Agaricus bisporus var. burnettii JB137-S8]